MPDEAQNAEDVTCEQMRQEIFNVIYRMAKEGDIGYHSILGVLEEVKLTFRENMRDEEEGEE